MLEWMLILTGGVNRLVEFLKRALDDQNGLTDASMKWVALGLSIILGVVSAFIGGANALALLPDNTYTANLPDSAGIIAAGLLIGLGTNILHAVGDWASTLGSRNNPQPEQPGMNLENYRTHF